MPLGSRQPLVISAVSRNVSFHFFMIKTKNTHLPTEGRIEAVYLQRDLGE